MQCDGDGGHLCFQYPLGHHTWQLSCVTPMCDMRNCVAHVSISTAFPANIPTVWKVTLDSVLLLSLFPLYRYAE